MAFVNASGWEMEKEGVSRMESARVSTYDKPGSGSFRVLY